MRGPMRTSEIVRKHNRAEKLRSCGMLLMRCTLHTNERAEYWICFGRTPLLNSRFLSVGINFTPRFVAAPSPMPPNSTPVDTVSSSTQDRLDSWKEIACYLRREVRT